MRITVEAVLSRIHITGYKDEARSLRNTHWFSQCILGRKSSFKSCSGLSQGVAN